MKQYVIIIAAAALAMLALSAAITAFTPAPFDPVLYERQQIAIERMHILAPVETFAAGVLTLMPAALAVISLVLLTAWGSVAVIRFRRERHPDSRGLLPCRSTVSTIWPRSPWEPTTAPARSKPHSSRYPTSLPTAHPNTTRPDSIIEESPAELLYRLLMSPLPSRSYRPFPVSPNCLIEG